MTVQRKPERSIADASTPARSWRSDRRAPRARCAGLRRPERCRPVSGSGRSRVAVAFATTVALRPRSIAARAVASTHICVMKPTSTIAGPLERMQRGRRDRSREGIGQPLGQHRLVRCRAMPARRSRRPACPARTSPPLAVMDDVDDRRAGGARSRQQAADLRRAPGRRRRAAGRQSTYSCWASMTTTAASARRAGVVVTPASASRVVGAMGSPQPGSRHQRHSQHVEPEMAPSFIRAVIGRETIRSVGWAKSHCCVVRCSPTRTSRVLRLAHPTIQQPQNKDTGEMPLRCSWELARPLPARHAALRRVGDGVVVGLPSLRMLQSGWRRQRRTPCRPPAHSASR